MLTSASIAGHAPASFQRRMIGHAGKFVDLRTSISASLEVLGEPIVAASYQIARTMRLSRVSQPF